MIASLLGGLLFGTLGFLALIYGKRQYNFKMMALGMALMAYPYFVSNTVLLYVVGVALVAALFIFRN